MKYKTEDQRSKKIIIVGMIGVAANMILAIFKAIFGMMAGSIAIMSDAVNNFSDSLSSLITIVGAKLSTREPDRKHPYGYGRIEHLSAMIIGVVILYAGFQAIIGVLNEIAEPSAPEYTTATMVVVAAAVLAKVIMGVYTKKAGKDLDSGALIASGKDYLNDVIVSLATLLTAIIYNFTSVNINIPVGAIISFLIVKTGFDTLRETISEILGERVPPELAKAVKASIRSFPEVMEVSSLNINNYGKNSLVGSVHIMVPASLTASFLDSLERSIAQKVLAETGVILNGISIYSFNYKDKEALARKEEVKKIAGEYPGVLQVNNFFVDKIDRTIRFDVVMDFDVRNKADIRDRIAERVKELYPEFGVSVSIDYDFSD